MGAHRSAVKEDMSLAKQRKAVVYHIIENKSIKNKFQETTIIWNLANFR
jgi:hypothetical protein